jgi:hypothetical protein
LLDQKVVAGLGNIYVCEALYRARLSPKRMASTIAERNGQPNARAQALVDAIKAVLNDAIKAGGSSLRDHRRADGSLGDFQHNFQVYDREGAPERQAVAQARLVHRGLRRLHDHGVGETPVLQGPRREGAQRVGQALRGGAPGFGDSADHLDFPMRHRADDLREQVRLRGEVTVDGADAHLGHAGHRGDLGLAEAALGYELPGGAQDALAISREAGLDLVGSTIRHDRNSGSVLRFEG